MSPESKAPGLECDSKAASSVVTLLVGYYDSNGRGGSTTDFERYLDQLRQHNSVCLAPFRYRFRDEAFEALNRGEVQYLYDPDWARKDSYSNGVIFFGVLLALLCFGLFVRLLTAAAVPDLEATAGQRIRDLVLALLFGCGCFCTSYFWYKEIRLKRGEVEEILEHPLVLLRAPKAPILHRQCVGKSDRFSAFT